MWIGDPVIKDIRKTKEESETRLLKLNKTFPELLGYGISKNSPERISVLVEKITPEIERIFRDGIRGHDVVIVEIGHVVALSNTSEYNPISGGISIGHQDVTAGTLGSVVYDRYTKEQLILSNSHVLSPPGSLVGDYIIQPGRIDGGKYPEDVEATLLRYVPFREENIVDAAVAIPDKHASDTIVDIGNVSGTTYPKVMMYVKKSGRTTGLTKGIITDTDATVIVDYGNTKHTFKNQFITTPMSTGGDSGSLVLESGTNKAVGLLFAGSNVSSICNNINDVMSLLNIEFANTCVPTIDTETMSQNDVILIVGTAALLIALW